MFSSRELLPEIHFITSRSTGPGGQNVNKVESKVTLRFDIHNSNILSDNQKSLLFDKLSARMTKKGILIISSKASRSQLENKKNVLKRLEILLKKAFEIKKNRLKTKPSRSAIEKRIKEKKILKEKKERRRNL